MTPGEKDAAAAVQSAYQSANALRKAYQQVELAVERLSNQQLTAQVHMDVKTPNVLLGRNNVAKLADVGLAKFLHKDYLSAAKSVVRAAHPLLLVWRCHSVLVKEVHVASQSGRRRVVRAAK